MPSSTLEYMLHTHHFAIGDIQGCAESLDELIFKRLPPDSQLRFVGDLVNRGPASARTLRTIRQLGVRSEAVLGNHDIHLLAVVAGVRKSGRSDTLGDILNAPDCDELITWLRNRPLAIFESGFLLVHAGVLPQWTAEQVLDLAGEVERELRGANWKAFLQDIFGNTPDRWHWQLKGIDRHRVVVNALTRLRFCTVDGAMDLKTKEGLGQAPDGFMPWFDVPERRTEDVTVVCGHWSTLGLVMRPNMMALDTGCIWGGQLTAARLAQEPAERMLIQVKCPQYRDPLA